MKKEKIIVYTDGGSRGNPGPAGIGVAITDEKGNLIKGYSNFLGVKTNNEAEYEAVVFALQKLKALFGKEKVKQMEIEFKMDSQLIARQLNGQYRIEEEKLFPLFIKIWNLRMDFGPIKFTEIPREQNKEADRLANEAMDEGEIPNSKRQNPKLF
ncbi:MAG: ribonuclease HI family protein [Candidatus Pacebacteria bacterium]|nr:ribonuclease HI family protein [Candidatus Paceibacterota bacterium]NUQ56986.1 ribonuclease HI family protein [Candidatus Paceibacter sp.]